MEKNIETWKGGTCGMAKYVIKRVAYGVVTLFVLVSLTFFMQQLLPGDPFVGEKNLPEATMEASSARVMVSSGWKVPSS